MTIDALRKSLDEILVDMSFGGSASDFTVRLNVWFADVERAIEEEREAILRIVKGEEEHGEHNRIGEYACAARAIEGKIRARGEKP
jgi:hypothetical protein